MPFANNNGVKIHYHTKGQGPHIILMHGFMGDIGSWEKLGYPDTLAPNHTVVIIDARGTAKATNLIIQLRILIRQLPLTL